MPRHLPRLRVRLVMALLIGVVGPALLTPPAAAAVPARVTAATDAAATASPANGGEATALAQARRTGAPVEVMSARTETSQLFARPDGHFEWRESLEVQRVHRADGSWAAVDTALRRAADGSLQPTVAAATMSFSGGGTNAPLAAIADGNRRVALWWPTALPTPTVAGNLATYPEVLPGVDLQVRADATGFTHLLVVRTPKAAANPALRRLTLRTQLTGVSLRRDTATGVVSAVDSAGQLAFGGPSASMWDSSDQATSTTPADPRRAGVGVELASSAMTLVPDPKLLDDKATRYPVYIDPTWIAYSGKRNHWTVLRASEPSRSFYDATSVGSGDSTSGIVRAGFNDFTGVNIKDRSLFNMDVSGVRYARINKATFSITQSWSGAGCGDTTGNRIVQLRTVSAFGSGTVWNTSWNSSGSGWGAVLAESNKIRRYGDSCAPQRVEFSVTGVVASAAASGASTINLGLRAKNESDRYSWKRYRNDAVLAIEYNNAPDAPSAPTTDGKTCATGGTRPWLTTLTPSLTAKPHDPNAAQQSLTTWYHWWRVDGGARNDTDKVSAVSANPTTPVAISAVIPAGKLVDGVSYSWQARTTDGIDYGAWSAPCEFTVDTSPPGPPSGVAGSPYLSGGTGYGGVGVPGTFHLSPPSTGAGEVVGYAYTLDSGMLPAAAPQVTTLNADLSADVTVTPTRDGSNTLRVWTKDRADRFSTNAFSYTFTVLSGSGPGAQWLFDDQTGADATGHGHGLTLVNAPTFTTGRGGAGSALQLNGTTQSATTSWAISTNASFTVTAWVKLSTAGGTEQRSAFAANGVQTSPFMLGYSGPDNKWRFTMASSDVAAPTTVSVTSANAAVTGRWTQLAGVYDASTHTLRLYVNGADQGSIVLSGGFAATGGLLVGRRTAAGAAAGFFPGAVDDVRAYNTMLTAAKIGDLTLPVPPSVAVTTPGPIYAGNTVTLSLAAGGDTNVTTFRYSIGAPTLDRSIAASGSATATATVVLPNPGQFAIYAAAENAAAGRSAVASTVVTVVPAPTVGGRVTDAISGSAIAGATVLLDPSGRTTTSGADGSFLFTAVPVGSYQVAAFIGDRCALSGSTRVDVLLSQQVELALTPIADAFGYTCGTATLPFPTGTTAIGLTGDNAVASVALPFAMPFYYRTYISIWIDTNGLVSFEDPQGSHPAPTNLPTPGDPDALVAAFWDDLVVDGSASVRTASAGTAPDRTFTVEWRDVHRAGDTGLFSVAVVLAENGEINTHYASLDTTVEKGGSATVGLESAGGEIGLEFSYQLPALVSGSAVQFHYPAQPQQVLLGAVSGTVTDALTGAPAAGVAVTLDPLGATAVTTSTGAYTFSNLEPGGYTVSAADTGRCARRADEYVSLSGNLDVDLAMGLVPDEAGWTCQAGPVPYVPADQTVLPLSGDDETLQITTPFPINLYGTNFGTGWVSTNGLVLFMPPVNAYPEPGATELPEPYSPEQPDAAVYAFWDDWVIDGTATIRTAVLGTAPHRTFVVEWRDARAYDVPTSRVTFEAIFHEEGGIDVTFAGIDPVAVEQGQTGAVAIENGDGTVALVHAMRQPVLANGQGVRFRPAPPSTGALSGVVRCNGVVVSGAKLAVAGQTATAGGVGQYTLPTVPVGQYALVATATSGACLGSTTALVTVSPHADDVIDIDLQPMVGPVAYTVTAGPRSLSAAPTQLSLTGDDEVAQVALPFPVKLYGTTYTTAYVSTNGLVSFVPILGAAWDVSAIPSPTDEFGDGRANAAVYPFWNDWVLGGGSGVFTGVSGAVGSRQFVIQWRSAVDFDEPQLSVSFEVVLYENGDIAVAWDDIGGTYTEQGGTAVIGVENEAGTAALSYGFMHPVVRSGQGLLFHPVGG